MFPIFAGSNPSGYNLTRSLRFRASASASLSRTPAVAGNRQIFTYSAWIKRGTLDATFKNLFYAYVSTSDVAYISITSSNQLTIAAYNGGSFVGDLVTTQVFRDPSAWYHIVIAVDTTQATASNRIKMYVNGSQITAFATATYPPQNTNFYFNAQYIHRIAASDYPSGPFYFDGYIAEHNWIDGQALTPSSFGSTNTLTGVWQPAAYTGSYGTNGFYLPFTDNSGATATTIGKDFSGNGNNWTPNNISVTAGVTYDSMTDVPTLTSATAANFCVWNPLSNTAGSLTNGNLTFNGTTGVAVRGNSTIAVSSGKWYFESTLTTADTFTVVGIGQGFITNQYPGFDALSYVQTLENATSVNNNVVTAYGSTFASGDVFMCAFDLTNNKIFFGKNGTWFNSSDPAAGTSPAYTLTAGTYCPIARPYSSSVVLNSNFGQRPFTYTPPTGFVALNTFNLPNSTIVKGNTVMDATLYTGNSTGSTTQTITNAGGFKPDLVWVKSRSTAFNNLLQDSVRGATNYLISNNTDAAVTYSQGVTSFNANGFSLGTDANSFNGNGLTFVGWQWQAGQGSSSSNTSGTITSTVSVNASAGFSVVTWTGASGTNTIGHGLGVAPSWIVTKSRSATGGWPVYHVSIGGTGAVQLESSGATNTNIGYWNNTAPTSSVFTTSVTSFPSGTTFVAYCFAQIPGFSSFGSYTGNGSTDGPFIYMGFRPKYFLIKCTSTGGAGYDWYVLDSVRNAYNFVDNYLYPNYNNAEAASGANFSFDFVSNGIKIRGNGNGQNQNGQTFIYAAFAENPFKNSLAR